ncbi:MAG: hypothetical protein ACI9VR_002172 [Cognaticolwellia sp.]
MSEPSQDNLIRRFRKWAIWAIAFGALLYVGGSVWAGLRDVQNELANFSWWLAIPVLLLTVVNYGLRFVKWHYLLGQLQARVPWKENLRIFIAGLAMVISPAKAGELLKPYLVSKRTGVPMATTLPALVAERLTDAIAVLALAAISVGTYATELESREILGVQVSANGVLVAIAASIVLGLAVLSSKRVSFGILGVMGKVPLAKRVVPKLEEMYRALVTCLAPVPLLWTVFLSLVAWGAECWGFQLVLIGLGVEDAALGACTFIYAFATIAGGPSPGGLGIADGALVGMTTKLIGTNQAIAVTGALLIRIATLWFGVGMGAIALMGFDKLLDKGLPPVGGAKGEEREPVSDPDSPQDSAPES